MDRTHSKKEKWDQKTFDMLDLQLKTFLSNSIYIYHIDYEARTVVKELQECFLYDKYKKLKNFLLSYDSTTYGPLLGRDLKNNGFEDIIGFLPSPSDRIFDATDWSNIDKYAIHDNDIIDLPILASRLWRISIYNSMLRHLKKDVYYAFATKANESCLIQFEKIVHGYLEFLKYGDQLKETHPYITIHFNKRNYSRYENIVLGEFLPETLICVNGRPFVSFQQHNTFTCYDNTRFCPLYRITSKISKDIAYKVDNLIERGQLSEEFNSVLEACQFLFNLPDSFRNDTLIIAEIFNNIFAKKIDLSEIVYNWVKGCYCFKPTTEDLLYNGCSEILANSQTYCKYTSFDTLKAIIESGNMRLNSIIGMNDPTESEKLKNDGSNFQEPNTCEDDILKESNYYYITSFSSQEKEDDLTMWRFYGDNGAGVCLVFTPLENATEKIYSINYVDFDSPLFNNINTFMSRLIENKIKFSIESFVQKSLLMKPKDYESESEKRLCIASLEPSGFAIYDNNILTPFLTLKLPNHENDYQTNPKDFFPLKLVRIILGPEMKNKEINRRQVEFMLTQQPNLPSIKVEVSRITCYRR